MDKIVAIVADEGGLFGLVLLGLFVMQAVMLFIIGEMAKRFMDFKRESYKGLPNRRNRPR